MQPISLFSSFVLGFKGREGREGFPGIDGSGSLQGHLVVTHSQSTRIPTCPSNTNLLWEGYSLLFTEGDSYTHHQELGKQSCHGIEKGFNENLVGAKLSGII